MKKRLIYTYICNIQTNRQKQHRQLIIKQIATESKIKNNKHSLLLTYFNYRKLVLYKKYIVYLYCDFFIVLDLRLNKDW